MGNRCKAVRAAACLLVIWGCNKGLQGPMGQNGMEPTKATPQVKWTIELTGSGLGKPTVFTFEQLARMEMTRLDNVLMLKSHEPDETSSWRGPSLDVLLTAAQIKPGPMNLTMEAADGYEFECGRRDMASAIVAIQDGTGRWLAEIDRTCPVRLVPPRKPGDYWIMNLSRITIEPVAGPEPSE